MIITALACLLCTGGGLRGSCRCGEGALDLALIIDTTGSMHLAIGTVKAQMLKIIEVLAGRFETLRVGVVAYRTTSGPQYAVKALALTDNIEQVREFISDLRASGGGGEAVGEAIKAAVEQQPWRPDARKVAILVGDEPPAEGTREEAVAAALGAAERGIVIHSITMSETAWRYFEFNNPAEFKRMKEAGLVGSQPERDFVLPSFKRISDATKGQAAPGTGARSIVKWLLALSSGDSALGDSADLVMLLQTAAPAARPRNLPVLMARLKYQGYWDTPRDFERLLKHLEEYLPARAMQALEGIGVGDDVLAGVPLLYASGHGPLKLAAGGERRLREYLEAGGCLWADACCGDPEFVESAKSLAAQLFPEKVMRRMDGTHPLFRAAIVRERVRYTAAHRSLQYAAGAPEAYVLELDAGRPAVILTPHSWGAGWASYPFGRPCLLHDDDALALSLNLLVYLLEARWCRM